MSDLEELKAHLPSCPGCRSLLGDFAQINAQALPIVADKHARIAAPVGMTERFVARARSEGLNLARGAITGRSAANGTGRRALWGAFAASAAVIIFSLGLATGRIGTRGQDQHPGGGATATRPPLSDNSKKDAGNDGLLRENAQLKQELRTKQTEREGLVTKLASIEENFGRDEHDKADLNARLAKSEAAIGELRTRETERENETGQLRAELARLRSEKEADRVASFIAENELKGLRGKVAQQSAELNQRQQLTAVADQARELVVARNLHIVDVHDADDNGKGQRAFGRIFYTEGKSLVFYAYDLADPRKLNAKISFYVWGEKLGATQPVKNLGIFHSDDANDGRWVLTFDDARVLSQINSVFVTIEASKRTVTEPSGKKILYAFLGNQANHP